VKETVLNLKDVLNQGLAPRNNPRNNPMLIDATGAFIFDGALEAVEQFISLALPAPTGALDFVFPYPQLFVLSDATLLCNADEIWELNGTSWVSMISGLTVGTTWTVVDAKSFLLLSNMRVTVIRDPRSGEYSIDSSLPTGSYGNFNGQLCCGSPNVPASGDI
jgi:hypothetical protein